MAPTSSNRLGDDIVRNPMRHNAAAGGGSIVSEPSAKTESELVPGVGQASSRPALRRVLEPTDFTLLVVGAVVGAGIYVVAGMGARLLGLAQLVAWVIAD